MSRGRRHSMPIERRTAYPGHRSFGLSCTLCPSTMLWHLLWLSVFTAKNRKPNTWSKNPVTLEKDPLPRGRRFRPWPYLPAAGPRPTRWNPQLCRKQWREWQARTPRPCLGLIKNQSRTWSSEGGVPLWRDCIRRYLIRLMSVDRRFGSSAQNHFSLMAIAVHDVQRTPLKTNHAHVWSDRHYQPMKLWFPPHARGSMLT